MVKQLVSRPTPLGQRRGDTYFLSEVFLKGDNSGNRLPKPRMERKLEEGGAKVERHAVAASRKQSKRANQSAKKGS